MESLYLEEKEKGIFRFSNVTFLLLACLFCVSSIVLSFFDLPFKVSVLIIQYGIILLPLIISLKIKGVSIREKFLFKKVRLSVILMTLVVVTTAIPVAYTLNFLVSFILLKLDIFVPVGLDVHGEGVIHNLSIVFLVSLTPGFVEEFFFRGMLLSGYKEKLSPKVTIVVTALLFAMFHFTIQNFMLPFFLGLILAWMVYKTGSIIPSMIAHASFNFVGVMIMLNVSSSTDVNAGEMDALVQMLDEQFSYIVVGFIFILAFTIPLLIGALLWFKSLFPKFEVGDKLVINEEESEVLEVTSEKVYVMKEDEKKSIQLKKLKKVKYKILKQNMIYEKVPTIIKVVVGVTFALYAFMNVLSIVSYKLV